MDGVTYRAAYRSEWDICMDLAWRTFLKYEASDYTQEGIDNFKAFVSDGVLKSMFDQGAYQVFVAVYEKKVIGLVSLRDRNHISLLFVESAYHHMGIGTGLLQTLCEYMYREMGQTSVTVNAAPHAVEFYHKVGFTDTAGVQVTAGITYTPMVLYI